MKKIILLFLIIFTNNAFSQTYGDTSQGKFDIMADLSNHNKIEEAKKIADDLLSGTYGKLSGYAKFFTLYVVADYYYIKDDYQKAYDFYQQFLDFDKNENPKNLNNKKIDNKKIYIDEAKAKLQELKLRLSLVSTNTSNNNELTDFTKDESNKNSDTNSLNGNTASDNSNTQEDIKETNTDKTVTITVTGTGKTNEEAKTNALRSAIEQAFGAFISSKTEILNDNLVKDEIVSVASGNVQKYSVISELTLPSGDFAIILNVIVSLNKLTSYAENKGIVIEFKGGLFAANIKLQKMNEENEIKVILNMLGFLHEKLQTSFDYKIQNDTPKLIDNVSETYKIPLKVTAICNSNMLICNEFLIKTLKEISLNDTEIQEYNKSDKKVYNIQVNYNGEFQTFNLRNYNSLLILKKIQDSWLYFLTRFEVDNGVNKFIGSGSMYQFIIKDDVNERGNLNSLVPFLCQRGGPSGIQVDNIKINFNNGNISFIPLAKIDYEYGTNDNTISKFVINLPLLAKEMAFFDWGDIKNLQEIEKIDYYKITPTGVTSKFRQGGYVVYEKDGHGIIACPLQFETDNYWNSDYADGANNPTKNIITKTGIGEGMLNTLNISKTTPEYSIANKCLKLKVNSYSDWYIPSKDELCLLANKLFLSGIIENRRYVSSSEYIYEFDTSKVFALFPGLYLMDFIKKNISNYNKNTNNISLEESYELTPIRKNSNGYHGKAYIIPIRYF